MKLRRENKLDKKKFRDIYQCWCAMAAHYSQFVWFRKLFIFFSRWFFQAYTSLCIAIFKLCILFYNMFIFC